MLIIEPKLVVEQVDEILLKHIREEMYPVGNRMPCESVRSDELGGCRAAVWIVEPKPPKHNSIILQQSRNRLALALGANVFDRARPLSRHPG